MRTSVVALSLALGAALMGCSDDGSAAPAPLPSVASPTAAPVPSPPALAAEETIEGADAFARYYLAVIDDSYERSDAEAVRALSSADCDGCQAIARDIETLSAADQRREAGLASVTTIAVAPIIDGDVTISLTLATQAGRVLNAQGGIVSDLPAVPEVRLSMRLLRTEGGWLVRGYAVRP